MKDGSRSPAVWHHLQLVAMWVSCPSPSGWGSDPAPDVFSAPSAQPGETGQIQITQGSEFRKSI